MKHLFATLSLALLLLNSCAPKPSASDEAAAKFVTISGQDLIQPDGSKLFITGTNLGNWLNPEGYMFRFNKANSGRFINEMFSQIGRAHV